ncbi:Plasma membrane calcium-transporting ATPase 4 [Eumeta japonica]|uniref:Plasma membrane calcium-transporting ATPase 4 n=1 Tax=Eumeta variegata TaxID=151549 RepID=A0A4C1X7U8_EUMVA|nr:Plasma membrane calcium-transporting ATPase 4 [Eumeta japonica]
MCFMSAYPRRLMYCDVTQMAIRIRQLRVTRHELASNLASGCARAVGRRARRGAARRAAMATVEGRPAQYGVTLRQLRELMESRGAEGLAKINALGGSQDICKKLYTSPTDGQ